MNNHNCAHLATLLREARIGGFKDGVQNAGGSATIAEANKVAIIQAYSALTGKNLIDSKTDVEAALNFDPEQR